MARSVDNEKCCARALLADHNGRNDRHERSAASRPPFRRQWLPLSFGDKAVRPASPTPGRGAKTRRVHLPRVSGAVLDRVSG